MVIRETREQDWPAIYPFFSAIVAAGETYAYPENLSSDDARDYWVAPPPGRTVTALDDEGTIVGSASMGPNRPGRGAHIATASFMVAPDRHGRGIGRSLGEHVVEWARSEGYAGIQFNAVVETNESAVHLWQSLGFEIIGTVPGAFRHPRFGFVGLHLMFCELGSRERG